MLSMYHDDEYAFRALRIGAFAYLNKNSSADLLITVIRRINSGRKYIDPRIAEELIFNQNPKSDLTLHCLLSDREYEILRLITEGVPLSKISSSCFVARWWLKVAFQPGSLKTPIST